MASYSAYLLNAFLIALAAVRPLMRLAPRLGLVDRPDHRKRHAAATPVVGGAAIFVALLASGVQLPAEQQEYLASILPGLGLLVLVGVLDDRRAMTAKVKMACQIAAALLMILPTGLYIEGVGGLLGATGQVLDVFQVPLTVFFVIAVVNAFNLIDGIDGLAGGVSAGTFAGLAVMALLAGREELAAVALLTLFAILGFLFYNIRHPWRAQAEVFLGDAGSMMLGATAALIIIPLSGGGGATQAMGGLPPLAALLWLIALPCLDMASLIVRRTMAGASPLSPDRRHIHHLLVDRGIPVATAACLIIACSMLLGCVGVVGWLAGVGEQTLLLLLVVPLMLHTAAVVALSGGERRLGLDRKGGLSLPRGVNVQEERGTSP